MVPGRLAIGPAVGVHVRVHGDGTPGQWQQHHHDNHLADADEDLAGGYHGDFWGRMMGYHGDFIMGFFLMGV